MDPGSTTHVSGADPVSVPALFRNADPAADTNTYADANAVLNAASYTETNTAARSVGVNFGATVAD